MRGRGATIKAKLYSSFILFDSVCFFILTKVRYPYFGQVEPCHIVYHSQFLRHLSVSGVELFGGWLVAVQVSVCDLQHVEQGYVVQGPAEGVGDAGVGYAGVGVGYAGIGIGCRAYHPFLFEERAYVAQLFVGGHSAVGYVAVLGMGYEVQQGYRSLGQGDNICFHFFVFRLMSHTSDTLSFVGPSHVYSRFPAIAGSGGCLGCGSAGSWYAAFRYLCCTPA